MSGEIKNSIRKICEDLGLPSGDQFTQDWAYELPEQFRSYDFFWNYVRAYQNPAYGDIERRLLAQLMLDIVNDLLAAGDPRGKAAWNSLSEILLANKDLHRDQVEYWALRGESLDDAFQLSPLARQLLEQL
jgi:hypothetical protein